RPPRHNPAVPELLGVVPVRAPEVGLAGHRARVRGLPGPTAGISQVEQRPAPHIEGLFETHLTVSDLDRSVAFYRDVVGLTVAYEIPERGAAFMWIGAPGEAMLGLWSIGSSPIGLDLHLAFRCPLDDVLDACGRLRSRGVTPLSFFATETA